MKVQTQLIKEENKILVHNQITAPKVTVIGVDGQKLGEYPLRAALDLAEDMGLDLVEVSDKGPVPICKIMNYGKFAYEQNKKLKASRKINKAIETKEMMFSLKIDTNDFNVKVSKIKSFLSDGHNVKATLQFKGREATHSGLGYALIDRLIEEIKVVSKVDSTPEMNSGKIIVMFKPNK